MAESDEVLRANINSQVDSVMANFTGFYDISAEQVFENFIANNDVDATALAEKIMNTAKVSYAYGIELQNLHPSSTEINVEMYQDILDTNAP